MKFYITLIAFVFSIASFAQTRVKVVNNISFENVIHAKSSSHHHSPRPRPHYRKPHKKVHHYNHKKRHHAHGNAKMFPHRHHRR